MVGLLVAVVGQTASNHLLLSDVLEVQEVRLILVALIVET